METTVSKDNAEFETSAVFLTTDLFTTRAARCAVGVKLRAMKIFETIGEHLKIKQKTIKHMPLKKLPRCFYLPPVGRSRTV